MIFVKRGPAPQCLRGKRSARAFGEMSKHYAVPMRERGQRTFDFARFFSSITRDLREALSVQFNSKCAYCESEVGATSPGDIEWFRPRAGVSDSSGEFLRDHYWAQALEWENIYLACGICNRHKAARFPVAGTRAPADADRKTLEKEQRLLIDPCTDDPQDHLIFDVNGKVSGITDRGKHTIEILALNRPQLIKQRQFHAKNFAATLIADPASSGQLLEPDAPYLAVKNQLLRGTATGGTARAARAEQKQFDTAREDVATETKASLEHYRSRSRYIERLRIENIASVEKLELNLEASAAHRTPCFALLGVNGVGKSTVLKAIAIALGGADYVSRLRINPQQLIRHGKTEGSVRVWIGGYKEPVELVVSRRGGFRFSDQRARVLALAYGSSRLLPTQRNRPRAGKSHAKIDNLFDPFLPLADAEKWLRHVAPAQFDDAARTMRALLPVDDTAEFVRARRGAPVSVRFGSHDSSRFAELSDGYQSMLGLAADILEILYAKAFTSASAGQAIVIIDELGNHLHPAWRLCIVGALRRAFPQVQFIYSTHDPLCLRGLDDGEVAVLRRDARHKVYPLEDLPSIAGLRVDQLLTSEHFGLDTTVDPETEAAMKRYRELALDTARSAATQQEYDELKRRLTEVRLLGGSHRERLMLQAIDEELAKPVPPSQASVSARLLNERSVERARRVIRPALAKRPAKKRARVAKKRASR